MLSPTDGAITSIATLSIIVNDFTINPRFFLSSGVPVVEWVD